ncbi:MAG: DMT family transporter [Clostridia bacterium]|nr:DMT family transporter [Clostridia bacterium]
MNKKILAIGFAILAAGLYAINIPLSKLLLQAVEPTMMAAYLYLGAGIGIGAVFLLTRGTSKEGSEPITKRDMPNVVGMILLDILAPILLMFGLLDSAASNASLLNNFEIVCTSLIALLVFREAVSGLMWIAISLITVSGFLLSVEDLSSFRFSWGAILVLLATLCWGLENNCTKNLSGKNTYHIVFLKGIFSGLGALTVALCIGEHFASLRYVLLALLLGFVAYGLSIFFYIRAQGVIGAAKTSAYYAVAPFVGALLSFLLLREAPTPAYFVGLAVMLLGTGLVVADTLTNRHTHAHCHRVTHTHGGSTHSHVIEHTHEHNHYGSTERHRHLHRRGSGRPTDDPR